MMQIPFLNFEPMHSSIREDMLAAFQRVYDRNWFVMGSELREFEESYARFNQVGHAVGVSNGLDALQLSLKVLGINKGDEVIMPSNTYIATALSASILQAKPVFVEPDPETYNLAPQNIEKAISRRTKAIIPVHLYGQACEMRAIMEIAERHRLYVVEDNAQAHGSTFENRFTGSWGHVNATSFYPGKNLGALGDGGAVTTDDEQLANRVRILRNYGSSIKYRNEALGYNMRLDELQAAFLSCKLRHLEKWTGQRREIAGWYNQELCGVGDLRLPVTHSRASHVFHLYVVRTKFRTSLQDYLTCHGIGTLIHYPIPPHLQEAYKELGHKRGDFPIAEEMADTCLSLPLWPGMAYQDVEFVAEHVREFFRRR